MPQSVCAISRPLRRSIRPCGGLIGLFLLTFCWLPSGCGGGADDQAQGHGPNGAGGHQPPQQALPVAVQAVITGDIASYYNATATLEAEKEAQVLARVEGVIETIQAEEGDQVTAGQALLTIANGEYRLRLQQAEARTANFQARHDRLKAMLKEELASEEEYQTVRSDLASAEADEGLARLDLSYTTVTAPFAGRITQRLVDVGQNLAIGGAVFVLADCDPLLARVHVPSREFNKLQKDQPVTLVLDSSSQRLQGRVKLISPIIDPASGTIKVTIEVPDYSPDTRPGDFAEVLIVTEHREDSTLVPRGAVLTDKGETVVFVATIAPREKAESGPRGEQPQGERPRRQRPAGHRPQGAKPAGESGPGLVAERRLVTVGFTDDLNAEILSGLDIGEQVVVKGQRSLKHGTPLKVLEDQSSESAEPSGPPGSGS